MKTEENLEEALQLLLKLSNKPHFMYVDEVKEIAGLVHAAAQFKTPPALSEEITDEDGLFKVVQDFIYPHMKKGGEFKDTERLGDKKGWQYMDKETFKKLKQEYTNYLVKIIKRNPPKQK